MKRDSSTETESSEHVWQWSNWSPCSETLKSPRMWKVRVFSGLILYGSPMTFLASLPDVCLRRLKMKIQERTKEPFNHHLHFIPRFFLSTSCLLLFVVVESWGSLFFASSIKSFCQAEILKKWFSNAATKTKGLSRILEIWESSSVANFYQFELQPKMKTEAESKATLIEKS